MIPKSHNLWPKLNGPNAKDLRPVVLGLDVGTTATRASLACLDCDIHKRPEIVLRPKVDQHRERFEVGDFPSAANFFAVEWSPELCIGYIGDDPDQTPVKMYPYVARMKVMPETGIDPEKQLEDAYRRKFPQLNRFFVRYDGLDKSMQTRVLAHARKVFLVHLTHVRSSAEQLAESRGWEIKKVAATIPPDWDRWTQHFYMRLLQCTWNSLVKNDEEAITLLHESEAIGHWLLGLDQRTRNGRPKRLIIADFGGHTLSHNIFDINYRDDDVDQFAFTLSDDNCLHGGSELHASYVKEKIRKDIIRNGIPIEEEHMNFFWGSSMNDYRLYQRSSIDGQSFSITGWTKPGLERKPVEIKFSGKEASILYDTCFSEPLAELYSSFRKNAKLAKDAVVVLTGGSFSTTHVLDRTKEEIQKAGLKYPPWIDAVENHGRKSSSVAIGAALALVRAVSVEQFMRQTVFAVMVRNTDQDDLPVIWNSFGSQRASIDLPNQQGADVLIHCCPLPPCDGNPTVPAENTFEFQTLSKMLKGSYTFSLDYKERDVRAGLPDRLILTVLNHDAGKPGDAETVEWPVYYDPGACVIFVGIDEYDKTSSSEKDVPQLVPKGFRNKTGKNSSLLWERNPLGPGRFFWKGVDYENLPLKTLKVFEEEDDGDQSAQMEVVDVDSLSEPSPSVSRPRKRKHHPSNGEADEGRSKARDNWSTGSSCVLHQATTSNMPGPFI